LAKYAEKKRQVAVSVKHEKARTAKKEELLQKQRLLMNEFKGWQKDAAENASSRANETVEKRALRLI